MINNTENDITSMKALVFHGPNNLAWEDKPKPTIIQATDAIIRITTTTICGTDLHILKGDVPTVTVGRILGHEGVGIVEKVGADVIGFHEGDKVLISLITSCGRCNFCKKAMYSHCVNGGWLLGNSIDGTQAEYVRIPFADNGLYLLPPDVDDEAAVMLSCILPTGLECGTLKGQVKPGDIVAIVGAGPVGLAVLLTTRLVDAGTTPMLLKMVQSGRLDAKKLVSHRFELSEILKAYNTFGNAAKERALKVVINNVSAIG
jgi:alcohol dehydrogenase